MCHGRFAGVLRVLSKCFLLSQIFCQNQENAVITGHGERIDDLFSEISTIWSCITRFPEVVAQKSGDLQKILKVITILAVACDATRHQLVEIPRLVCREIRSTDFLRRQTKNLRTTALEGQRGREILFGFT